jgi:hypothetical protein
MPISDVLMVGAIVLAFVVFAAALAWSEYRTRHWRQIAHSVPPNAPEKVERKAANSYRRRDLRPV